MWYAIQGFDHPHSLKKRLAVRDQHLARLNALKDAGHLLVAGPHPAIDSEQPGAAGFTGSLIIAEFSSLENAQKWANEDPYIQAKVYVRVDVKPFIKALP